LPLTAARLQATLLREQVAGMVRDAIADMRLRPGERLTEREVIESTGVSRATVREALRELAAEGLVTSVPQRGVVVAAPTPEEARHLYEVRAALEALAGRLFVRNASEGDRRELRARLAELERVAAGTPDPDPDPRELLAAKHRFYEALLAGAGNPVIVSTLAPLRARITVLRAASMSRPGRVPVAVAELRAILAAVEAGDEDAAALACAAHVESAARSALGG